MSTDAHEGDLCAGFHQPADGPPIHRNWAGDEYNAARTGIPVFTQVKKPE